ILSTSGSYLTLFNGARNVTINGRMGSTRQGLIFENQSTSGWVFYFLNDASGDTIRNCIIKGAYSSTGIGTIYFASTSVSTTGWGGVYGGVTGNDNIMIDSCDILDAGTGTTLPTTSIYSSGSTSTTQQANSGNVISNNNIYNYFHASSTTSAAMYLTSGTLGWTITGNNIYQTAPRTHTGAVQYHGIWVNNSFNGSGFTINNNNIGGSAPNCAGTACTYNASTISHNFTPIQYTGDNTASSTIAGNKISNIAINSAYSSTGVGMFTGIYLNSGNATVQNNIIGGNNVSDTINIQQSTTATALTWANGIYSTSGGTVNISNNTIGGDKTNTINAQSSLSTGGFTFAGVNLQGSNNANVNNNTIGSSSTSNSILVNNSTAAASSQIVTGIWNQQSGSITISNNTIVNLTNNSTVSTAQIRGIATTSGINTITGNTIRGLSTTSTSTSTATSSAIVGIDMTSSVTGTAGQVVNNNTIHSLISTTTSAVGVNILGINYSFNVSAVTGLLATHSISGNNIHSLSISSSNTSTGVGIVGIHYAAGNNLTMANNMVRLGINADGTSITSGCTITGIWKNNVIYTATYNSVVLPMFNKFFHNSVYIGGSGITGSSTPGALNTFAFRRNGVTYFNGAIDSVYNNVFVNARSNTDASQTVRHWVQYYDDIQCLSQNYNDLQYTGTGGGLIAKGLSLVSPTEYSSVLNWRTPTGFDAHSFSANPNFSNPTGNATAVSLQIATSGTTPIEGAGVNIPTVTTDQKGSSRSTYTPTDIGADAGNFSANDITPPTISYTPLSTPVSSTAARSLTVTITDASGIPTTGTGLPRLYWRSGTSGAYTAVTGTSIGSGQYTFTNIGAGATAGSVIYYYVVAQDNATTPNITSNPIINAGNFTATPPVAGSAPVPNSYQILGTLCGTITVGGTGANFSTLKDAFDAINNSTVTCNLLINITGNTTETQTPVLNEVNYNGGPYTITIVPSGGARSITGSNTATIDLNGADRVVIDGRIDGTGSSKSLTIENNSGNGIAIRFVNGAQFNTVKNCIVRGANATGLASTSNPGGVIVFAGTNTTSGNSDNTISGCDIRDASNGQTPWYCVNSTNILTAPSLYNSRDTLLNNNIFNYFNSGTAGNFPAGIIIGDGNADWTIDGNSLYQTATRNVLLSGANIIQFRVIMANAGSGTFNIRNNFIGGSAPQCGGSAMTINALQGSSLTQVLGVQVPLPGTAIINNNKIANIVFNSAASGFVFTGLTLFAGNATITNNSIGGHAQTSDSISVTTAPTAVNLGGQTVGMQIPT
ncbi:MAG: hypothetical protein JNJ85_08510, partial [Candidatus Kapabacteria bacterium]|nr:hypothetical protein [Candidatus Kapabacteria bacterium]